MERFLVNIYEKIILFIDKIFDKKSIRSLPKDNS